MKATLYIIPVLLGGDDISLIPSSTLSKVRPLKYFIAEREKSARRFLKLAGTAFDQHELIINEIDKHGENIYKDFLKPALDGNDIGLLSEAGAPAVADPGSGFVFAAHKLEIKVVPLSGPSSILLALMASGLNGQSFCFHGYLPIESAERTKKILSIEKDAKIKHQTQLFIETPYRNNQLLKELLRTLNPETLLCIAASLSLTDEYIMTRSVAQWQGKIPELNKKPAVFLLL